MQESDNRWPTNGVVRPPHGSIIMQYADEQSKKNDFH